MLQPQIVEYAKSQLKLGLSRDAIKKALLGAGWPETDVDDSLASAEVMGGPENKPPDIAPGKPLNAAPADVGASAERQGKPFDASRGKPGFVGEEKRDVIRVSDLVSGVNSKLEIGGPPASQGGQPEIKKVSPFSSPDGGKPVKAEQEERKMEEPPASIGEISKTAKSSKALIAAIVFGVLAAGFAGAGAWLYLKNRSLSAETASLKNEVGSSGAKVSELESRAGNLQNSVDALNKEKQQLAMELEFFAVPPGTATGTEKTFSGLKGTLGGGGKAPYTLKTALGSVLVVKNYKDKEVAAVLAPLVGKDVSVSGTYVPGSGKFTVNEVNGSSTVPAAPAAPPVGKIPQ